MKNRFIKITAIIALTALLGGCYPSEAKPKNNSPDPIGNSDLNQDMEALIDGKNSVHLENENLTADMELPSNVPNEIPELKITLKKWNKAHMENILLGGKEIEEKTERDCDFYPGEKFYGYDTKDGYRVYFEPGRFCIDDKNTLGGEFKYGAAYYYVKDDYLANDEELSAFSRENAISRVNEILDKLEIKNYGTPKTAPLKADFANEILASMKKHREQIGEAFDYTPWTTEEEMYFLHYPLVYGAAELSSDMMNIPQKEWGVNGSCIDAVVTKDKVISIEGHDIYSENNEASDKIPINYNAVQAVEKLKEFYSNLVLDEPVNYYSCKLVYIPSDVTDDHMTVSFKPAWLFCGYSEADFELKEYWQEKQYFYVDTGFRYISR